jgi:hypothetical protein
MHTNQKFAASQMKKGNDKKSPNKDLINPNKEDKRLALSTQLAALTEDSNDEITGRLMEFTTLSPMKNNQIDDDRDDGANKTLRQSFEKVILTFITFTLT